MLSQENKQRGDALPVSEAAILQIETIQGLGPHQTKAQRINLAKLLSLKVQKVESWDTGRARREPQPVLIGCGDRSCLQHKHLLG